MRAGLLPPGRCMSGQVLSWPLAWVLVPTWTSMGRRWVSHLRRQICPPFHSVQHCQVGPQIPGVDSSCWPITTP